MFIELRDGVVRLDPDAAKAFAEHLMPLLRQPALSIAADFASQLLRTSIPYRLVAERPAVKKLGSGLSIGSPCGYCGQPLRKAGLKFCRRQCYLRHSVEVRQPIRQAQTRAAEMRAQGLRVGHGGTVAKKRSARISLSNARRTLQLTPEERRSRRAAQARALRARRKCGESPQDSTPNHSAVETN